MTDPVVSWKVNTLQWDSTDGGVKLCNYSIVASDGAVDGIYTASTYFVPNSNSPEFIPVENLTEEIVISWVKNSFDEEYSSRLENLAVSDFVRKSAPPLVVGVPWT